MPVPSRIWYTLVEHFTISKRRRTDVSAASAGTLLVADVHGVIRRERLGVGESVAQAAALENFHVDAVVLPLVGGAGGDGELRLVIQMDVVVLTI